MNDLKKLKLQRMVSGYMTSNSEVQEMIDKKLRLVQEEYNYFQDLVIIATIKEVKKGDN
jgi:hypothetical protein